MVDSTQSIRKRFDGKEYERRSHAEKRRLVQALMRSVWKPSLSGREKMPGRSLTVIQRTGMQYRAECGRFVRIQVVTRIIFALGIQMLRVFFWQDRKIFHKGQEEGN